MKVVAGLVWLIAVGAWELVSGLWRLIRTGSIRKTKISP